MENEMNETVEETQEDNNAIKQMRERIKELEAVEKELSGSNASWAKGTWKDTSLEG